MLLPLHLITKSAKWENFFSKTLYIYHAGFVEIFAKGCFAQRETQVLTGCLRYYSVLEIAALGKTQ